MVIKQIAKNLCIFVFLVLVVVISVKGDEGRLSFEPDADCNRNTSEMAKARGYDVETHKITTTDGYILSIFRINNPNTKEGEPIVLQSGILGSSDQWLDNGEMSLGYLLADEGYDVWLGNVRGNRYGLENIHYRMEDPLFWNFTYEEMGSIDGRAYIEYILLITGREQLGYVGHSQGNTQLFAAAALDPIFFNSRIGFWIALAPVVKADLIGNKFLHLFADMKIGEGMQFLGIHQAFPYEYWLNHAYAVMCRVLPLACDISLFISNDAQPEYDDQEKLQVYNSNFPAGTSVLDLQHFFQNMRDGVFARFQYPHSTLPLIPYNLDNLHINFGIFAGEKDEVASPPNTRWIRDYFAPTGHLKFYKEYPHMGHISFLIPGPKITTFLQDAIHLLLINYPLK